MSRLRPRVRQLPYSRGSYTEVRSVLFSREAPTSPLRRPGPFEAASRQVAASRASPPPPFLAPPRSRLCALLEEAPVRRARAVAVLLVVALLAAGVVAGPVGPAASGPSLWQRLSHAIAHLASPAQAQAATAPDRVEVAGLRTKYSRTYRT